MDTVRLKFNYFLPGTTFFEQKSLSKELELEMEDHRQKRYVYTNTPWRKQRQKQGLYTPKYWVEEDFKNPQITYFCIEFSAPKLLYGQNITELKDYDLNHVVKKLREFLNTIGVFITTGQILQSIPTLVAVGKNINLTHVCSCDLAIKILSPFDYKPHTKHRIVQFSDYEDRGKEIIFSIEKTETFKVYSKTQEIINQAKTTEEKIIAQALKVNRYQSQEGIYVNEILRVELTLKTKRKLQERFRPYLPNNTKPTFENIFKKAIWDELVKGEMNSIFNHPLKEFIFLAQEHKLIIEAILEKNFKHIEVKDTIWGFISSLQEYGLANTRLHYFKKYKSRQTLYNYFERLKKIGERCDFSSLYQMNNYKVYNYILKQCGIDTTSQTSIDFTTLSKKIDVEPRNTNGGLLASTYPIIIYP